MRSRVAEMEMEREEALKKRSRSLSVPSPDLVKSPDLALQATGQHRGAIMETLISRGSTLAQSSNRFGLRDLSSHARRVVAWGAGGVRVGEAQNPGPDDALELTKLDGGAHSPEESGAAGLTVDRSQTPRVS